MKKERLNFKLVLLAVFTLFTGMMQAQKKEKPMKLKTIRYEMVVEVTPEQAWNVLASYGDIADYHSLLESSKALNGSVNEAKMGSDRECIIPQGRRKVMVREKIIAIEEGAYYTYDVYDWDNFPLRKMHNTFGVKTNSAGQTVIYQKTDFRLKPRFLTGIMKGKLRRSAREALMAYKHYMETGEKKAPIKQLKKQYRTL